MAHFEKVVHSIDIAKINFFIYFFNVFSSFIKISKQMIRTSVKGNQPPRKCRENMGNEPWYTMQTCGHFWHMQGADPCKVQHLVQYFTPYFSLVCPARWSCAQYRRRRTRLYFRNIVCNIGYTTQLIHCKLQVQCASFILTTCAQWCSTTKSVELKIIHKAILTKFELNNVKHLKQILLACWYTR